MAFIIILVDIQGGEEIKACFSPLNRSLMKFAEIVYLTPLLSEPAECRQAHGCH